MPAPEAPFFFARVTLIGSGVPPARGTSASASATSYAGKRDVASAGTGVPALLPFAAYEGVGVRDGGRGTAGGESAPEGISPVRSMVNVAAVTLGMGPDALRSEGRREGGAVAFGGETRTEGSRDRGHGSGLRAKSGGVEGIRPPENRGSGCVVCA